MRTQTLAEFIKNANLKVPEHLGWKIDLNKKILALPATEKLFRQYQISKHRLEAFHQLQALTQKDKTFLARTTVEHVHANLYYDPDLKPDERSVAFNLNSASARLADPVEDAVVLEGLHAALKAVPAACAEAPRLIICESDYPQAIFGIYGSIYVTTRLAGLLTEEELTAAFVHELSHKSDKQTKYGKHARKRMNEYKADAFCARYVNAQAMKRVLQKVDLALNETDTALGEVQSILDHAFPGSLPEPSAVRKLITHLTQEMREGGFFDDHPPISGRLRILDEYDSTKDSSLGR